MPRFHVDQLVCLIANRQRQGKIISIEPSEQGNPQYIVKFSNNDIQQYAEELLIDADQPAQANDPTFKQAHEVNVATLWEQIHARFGDYIVPQGWQDFAPSPAVYAELDTAIHLHPALERLIFATDHILPTPGCRLYRHQAEAINAIYQGNHVTIVTPTASGKTLVYAIPTIDAILHNQNAAVLYLSPLNALVQDQLEAFSRFDEIDHNWLQEAQGDKMKHYLRTLTIGQNQFKVARYDGGVSKPFRPPIHQARPNIVITNPEMLHWSILPYHKGWKYLFQHLRFIIIDEMHTYKGFFGAHVANLMRRLRRLCHYYGADPHFICASATIKNPGDLAQRLTGKTHTVIGAERDGSPRYHRRFVLWDSARSGNVITTDAANLMAELMATHRLKTITFGRSINAVQSIYNYVAQKLKDTFHLETPLVQPYWSELTASEKQAIAHRLKQGLLHGVTATTALKLGIDIGDLSAAIIAKYPGSIADVWQQAGRAGRRGEALIFLIADSDPLNQYFANHPDEFFSLEPEEVFVDPDNKYAVLGQLWCAARDLPIEPQRDRQFFGDSLPEYLRILAEQEADGTSKIQRSGGKDVWVLTDEKGFPMKEVPIRAFGFRLAVYDSAGRKIQAEDDQSPILNVDSVRALQVLHQHARYQKIDDWYEVTDFTLDEQHKQGTVRVQKLKPPITYRTFSRSTYGNEVISVRQGRNVFGEKLSFGMIEFRSQVEGFYKVYQKGREDRHTEYQELAPNERPPERKFETTATWITLPAAFAETYDQSTFQAGLYSMTRALQIAATIQQFCDPQDIGGIDMVQEPNAHKPAIFLYDTTPGGVGISEQAFHNFERIFRRAYRLLCNCPNATHDPDHAGCPRCVTTEWGDEESVNRGVAIEMMQTMLDSDSLIEPKSQEEIIAILEREGYTGVRFATSGGMGSIYRGTYQQQERAIKVMKPSTALSRAALERMVQEISIWQGLIHPNIIRVLDVNQPSGVLYLSMEWMPGTLRDEMASGSMDDERIRALTVGIAQALKYLQEKGYVHRDVKPSNILLDNQGRPHLTDFGIARSINDTMGCQTQAGVMLGTIGYLAPEQIHDAATSGPKADVFALGIILWEMLTGKLPPRDTTGAVVLDAFDHIEQHHPPFAEIIQRMVASDPTHRIAAETVIAMLEKKES